MIRSLIVAVLAVWRRLTQKEVGARIGMPPKQVSYHLKEGLSVEIYERMLAGVEARPAHEAVVTACLEGLDALDRERELTVEERDEVELGVLDVARLVRQAMTEAVLRSRELPALDDYPRPADLEPCRWLAGEQWQKVQDMTEDQQLAVVRVVKAYQSWAFCEKVCAESTVQASRDLGRAAKLARLAVEVAERVRGPEGWRNRVRGYARAHPPNVQRVAGKLKLAEAALERAKHLWHAGSDPLNVLDPGRLLDLEASLRRDQRRFDEALALLKEAREVSRCPGRVLVKKGYTLEVMGEYERAVEALREAEPLIDRQADPHLWNKQRTNFALCCTHLGRYGEAAARAEEAHRAAVELGDEIDLIKLKWIRGRIAAGLGRRREARSLLEQARQEFAARKMWYDVAVTLLESAVLLLAEGQAAEAKRLVEGLSEVFESKGVHREALAALRLFQEAAEREKASVELARGVLRFLVRARHDQGLRFTAS